MAVKNKKCQEIKNISWVSSSFMDSFGNGRGDDEDYSNETSCYSPRRKKGKFDYSDDSFLKEGYKSCFQNVNKSNVYDSEKNREKTLKIWTEKYKPKIIDDLIINKKKISELEDWLKDVCNSNNSSSKILLITGSAGCGKTCTFNVLCKNLCINVIEWVTPVDINYENNNGFSNSYILPNKSVTQSFDEFILRATKYSSLITMNDQDNNSNKKIVLVKDFPNIFLDNPNLFHDIIKKYYINVNFNISPLVFIISCPNVIRDLFPDNFKYELNVTNINFNPVTQANIVKALNRILLLETKNNSLKFKFPNKNDLIDVAESSDGDLRSAILKLQFNLDNSSCGNNNLFKIPKSVSSNNERIKLKKSFSKNKVCEIDKDKKLDFFNSIGRVLYPKKETSDNKNEYRFVYSPDNIANTFLTEPNKFINILHENYLDRFTDIKDVSTVATNLSMSDILFSSCWEAKDVMVQYSLSTVTRSLMTSNSSPAPNKWKPMTKSKIWFTDTNKKENLESVRHIFPDLQSEKDILLDIIPYLKKLKVNLTPEQHNIISKIAEYNH
ncbi:cell cycle checkpoint protein RAD17-like isoform X1 [Lycorma delicatula]|uniref:cell cycle checkpoint protein RAD17-like isoform X1 n=1 Tax=Lycorma delicatula TaxID=130591 RepID=UPI003F51AB98